MSVRTYVSFATDFPTELNGFGPAGRELADFVTRRLREAGFAACDPEDRGGWAWEFFTRCDELEIMSIVGFVDDMDADPPRQWLITNDCELGFFERLFGTNAAADKREQFLRDFCVNLHRILTADSRFTHIAWYKKETFDKPDDQPHASP